MAPISPPPPPPPPCSQCRDDSRRSQFGLKSECLLSSLTHCLHFCSLAFESAKGDFTVWQLNIHDGVTEWWALDIFLFQKGRKKAMKFYELALRRVLLFGSYREEISRKSRWSLWRRPWTRKTQKLRQAAKQTRSRKRRWNAKRNAHAVRWRRTSGKESKDWGRLMRRWRPFYRDWNLFMFLLIDPFCSTVQSFTTFFSQYSSGFLSS